MVSSESWPSNVMKNTVSLCHQSMSCMAPASSSGWLLIQDGCCYLAINIGYRQNFTFFLQTWIQKFWVSQWMNQLRSNNCPKSITVVGGQDLVEGSPYSKLLHCPGCQDCIRIQWCTAVVVNALQRLRRRNFSKVKFAFHVGIKMYICSLNMERCKILYLYHLNVDHSDVISLSLWFS